MRPSPALNDLIRALENSPPENELSNTCPNTDMDAHCDGGYAKVSVTTSDLVYTSGNPIAISSTTGDDERERSSRKRKVKQTFAAKKITGNDKNNKKNTASSEKKRAVSDDDEINFGRKKILKECLCTKKSTTEEPKFTALEDFVQTIDEALQDQRIDEKKAERLHKCLQSGDWPEVAFSLLCEQIPMKRKGNGYSCRVCQVPKKGHTCMYCHVCSTPEEKFKKDDEHVCMKCPMCYEVGKKNKKIIQVVCGGSECPHGPHKSKHCMGV